ncbi:MAG TPA: crossover junction endodeoxyribonuclease RuvC [Thermomicrobiales bacterium]|nr:crossover junction endodeoxyribonuclease RuvC [Thermomicrobiales bacterium]
MITLGIDPGTALLGYGLIEGVDEPRVIEYGAIETSPNQKPHERLEEIFDALSAIMDAHRPDVVAVEQLFFARNVTTALAVGQARGVTLLAAAKRKIPVYEYKPAEVKLAVAGHGGAEKRQVQEMVRMLLRLDHLPQPDDAADALAIALCHAFSSRFIEATGRGAR